MIIDWKQASDHEKEIVKDYRRRKGLLRKKQLEMINQLDYEIICSNGALSFCVPMVLKSQPSFTFSSNQI